MCSGDSRGVYIGETSRNLYTRCKEHMSKYTSHKRKADSFIKLHQDKHHHGVEADFRAKVTGRFNDALSRQVSEGGVY